VIGGPLLGLYTSGTTLMVPDLWETVWAKAVTLHLVMTLTGSRLKSTCVYVYSIFLLISYTSRYLLL
jgi:hypothetical protein